MTNLAPAASGTPADAPRPAPKRPIDQAAALGVSEGVWLTAHQSDARVIRLALPAAAIIEALPPLGTVMALTRNHACVHEKDGAYANIEINGGMGLVLNHEIDLRLFMGQWAHAFAVETPLDDGAIRHSLQFFDKAGVAIHKIFARPQTDMAAWRDLVSRFAVEGPLQPILAEPIAPPAADRPDAEIDVEALRDGWWKLADVHDFFALLRKQGVGRRQAMRLAGGPFSRAIPTDSLQAILEQAVARDVPIMCFVGNNGCIQIHSGPIRRVVPMGPWLNILDPGFNLHLRADLIAEAYAVWKPQTDSAVHSIELFDKDGLLIAQFFGERKPGQPELEGWKQIVEEVPAA
ncbi:hemin-degrading factor [Sandaracinobacter neustonicus]|nr:ChuX/HutX family heme-like substrate-binding protein [Sandaracinobacter neustonicus]